MTDSTRRISKVLIWACVLIAGACAPADFGLAFQRQHRRYEIGFANDSDATLHDVQALWKFGTLQSGGTAGIVSVGAEKKNGDYSEPIPAQAEVSWRTSDGIEHHQQIAVASKIPDAASFNGTIWFKFTDAGVEVISLKDATDWLPLHHRLGEGAAEPATSRPALRAVASAPQPSARHPASAPVAPAAQSSAPGVPATQPTGLASAIRQALMLSHIETQAPGLVPMSEVAYADTPAGQAYIDARSAWVLARRELANAVKKRFGADVLPSLRLQSPPLAELARKAAHDLAEAGDPFPKVIESAKIDVAGDKADVHFGTAPVVHARKIAGIWKVRFDDLSLGVETRGEAPGMRPEPRSTLEGYRRLAQVDQTLARDVSSGKITSVDQLRREQSARESAAVAEFVPKPPGQ